MYFYRQDDEFNAICRKTPRNVSGHGDTLELPCIIAWPDTRQLCVMGSPRPSKRKDTADLILDVPSGDDTADRWANGEIPCAEFAEWLQRTFAGTTHRALSEVVALLWEPAETETPKIELLDPGNVEHLGRWYRQRHEVRINRNFSGLVIDDDGSPVGEDYNAYSFETAEDGFLRPALVAFLDHKEYESEADAHDDLGSAVHKLIAFSDELRKHISLTK